MNVLVTGSAGYIGSVLCKMLKEQGHFVVADDWRNDWYNEGSYCDRSMFESFDDMRVVQAVMTHDIKVIFHLAASSLLGPSAYDPAAYYDNNTGRTAAFVQKLIKAGWKGQFIFSSTAAVYGNQKTDNLHEHTPLMPCNHYGHSKMMCEHVLNALSVYGTIDVTMFRYFNVAGGYDDVGQDDGEPHLITRLCVAASTGNPMVVFGNDYPTNDGTCIRDYLHVRDVCRAQIHAMDQGITGTFNLGTEHGRSVLEVIKAFENVNGIKVPFEFGKRRKGDPDVLVANPGMYMRRYGFEYKHSSIEEIVESAWEYHSGI